MKKEMVLTRITIYHRGVRYPFSWLYQLANIPDKRFNSSEGSKSQMLNLAKNYPDYTVIDKTK